MRKGGGTADVSPSSFALTAFKPRQVLLAERQQQQQQRNSAGPVQMGKNQSDNLKPEQEPILTYSVALWLENKGFSKILKRFLSAAQIQDEDWKARALNLDDIFSKYQEICVPEKLNSQKKQEEQMVGATKNNGDIKCTGFDEKVDKFPVDQSAKTQKEKKKKKSKLTSKSLEANENNIDVMPEVTEEKHKGLLSEGSDAKNDSEVIVESKDKKKKKKLKKENLLEDDKNEVVDVDGANESKKASKKRKRTDSDENENQPGQEVAVEESKPKKTKGLEEGKDVQQPAANGHAQPQNKEENFSKSKSSRKQQITSSEPKTVNAFQRVKIDEVEFADERLQDNSYWAKAGAENGYGAKAQEILGQVKGRGFRHEKTKKKRGSYRGGIIDLQSHSIKFDNSDDE
ncbi:hypothetical protein ACJIZ3_018946 [Penstemon smallii]|uniref:Srp40 C-terminal domain-containing protein n=1 Tax=Penstemon smallii TaxID=265156 RepID=A0ABD3SZS3_9LAMI